MFGHDQKGFRVDKEETGRGVKENLETCNEIGKNCYIVDAVDQTIAIPNETEMVLVPDNIRPGSHFQDKGSQRRDSVP